MAWHGMGTCVKPSPVRPSRLALHRAPVRLQLGCQTGNALDGQIIGKKKGGGRASAPAGRLASWRGKVWAGKEGTAAANKLAFSLYALANSTRLCRQSFTSPAMGQVGLQMRGACRARVCKKALDDRYGPLHASPLAGGAEMHRLWTSITHASQPASQPSMGEDGDKGEWKRKASSAAGWEALNPSSPTQAWKGKLGFSPDKLHVMPNAQPVEPANLPTSGQSDMCKALGVFSLSESPNPLINGTTSYSAGRPAVTKPTRHRNEHKRPRKGSWNPIHSCAWPSHESSLHEGACGN
ncbi:hypothetical protein J3F83DRAFT_607705 [Trichoderma novae-zelandiae]